MNVTIIGVSGSMGSYFAKYFISKGYRVFGSDPVKPKKIMKGLIYKQENIEAVKDADLVIIACPINKTMSVINDVIDYLNEGSILVEITSLKKWINPFLTKLAKRRCVLSIHPLFGPSLNSLRHGKIVLIPLINPKHERELLKDIFPEAEVIVMDAAEHDKKMAFVLSLTHIMNLAYAATIANNEDISEFIRLTTPISFAQLAIAKSVISQNPELYSFISIENEFSKIVINDFIKELRLLHTIIENKQERSFINLLNFLNGIYKKHISDHMIQHVYDIAKTQRIAIRNAVT